MLVTDSHELSCIRPNGVSETSCLVLMQSGMFLLVESDMFLLIESDAVQVSMHK